MALCGSWVMETKEFSDFVASFLEDGAEEAVEDDDAVCLEFNFELSPEVAVVVF